MKKFTFFLTILCGIQIFSQITMNRDQSFGNNGVFTSEITSSQTILNSNIIILPDDSILYVINDVGGNYIFKLKPNGILDTGFANNGRLQFTENNFLNVVTQGEKLIVYFGPTLSDYNYDDSKIMRYHSNGTVDTTFGTEGVLNEVTESTNPQALSVLVLADLSLIVTNSNTAYPKKFTANGILDSTFGNNGEINYAYYFPLGQDSTGKIATCDITSLSSSIYSFFDLNAVTENHVLDLNDYECNQYNGYTLQNKSNLSTRMSASGMVYSVIEYQNYPVADFSRLVVIKNEQLDPAFQGNGFVTSADNEQFLDVGFSENIFVVLNQKSNQQALNAYSDTGNALQINNQRDFDLLSGQEIEVKDNYILVNSILRNAQQNPVSLKIEKFLITNESLSTSQNNLQRIEIENPVKDFLRIKNSENAADLELFNLEGRKVLSSTKVENIAVANLPAGNYILKITMKNGAVFSKKLIKN